MPLVKRREKAENQPVALGDRDLVLGNRVMQPLAFPETRHVLDWLRLDDVVVGVYDNADHVDLSHPGDEIAFGRALELEPDGYRHLGAAAVCRLAQPVHAVHPDIENLARLVHAHIGLRALARGGDFRTGNVIRRARAGCKRKAGSAKGKNAGRKCGK